MNYRLLPGFLWGILLIFPSLSLRAAEPPSAFSTFDQQLHLLVQQLNQEVYHTQLWLKAWENTQHEAAGGKNPLPQWGEVPESQWQSLLELAASSTSGISDLQQATGQFQHRWQAFQKWTQAFPAQAPSPVALVDQLREASNQWEKSWSANGRFVDRQWQFAKLVDQALRLSEGLFDHTEGEVRLETQRLIAFRNQATSFASPETQALLDQIDQVVQLCQEFIEAPRVPQSYTWGKAHYYYNHLLLPHLAGPGEGLIAQYNQWQQLQAHPMPPKIAPWPVFPREVQQLSQSRNLIFLVDNSGSMEKSGKLARVKQYLQTTLPQLSPNQLVAIIGFSGKNEVILPFTKLGETHAWQAGIDELAGKGTATSLEGFELAYMLAGTHAAGEATLVLLTDGGFDILDPLPQIVAQASIQGQVLHIRQVGQYEEAVRKRLRKLAELGGGSYGKMPVSGGLPALIQLP